MKTIATILTAFGTVFAGLQWWQIVYRLRLFYRDYGGQPNSNHIGDGAFVLIHILNLVTLIAVAFAVRTFWREPGAWRWFAISIAVTNAMAWFAFTYMHWTGALVEYHEFIRHMRGE